MADQIVLVPLGSQTLALTLAEFEAARKRASDLGLSPQARPERQTSERLVDSKTMAEALAVPVGWVEERARQGQIPSVVVGKYRRFEPGAVIAALSNQGAQLNDQNSHRRQRRNRSKI